MSKISLFLLMALAVASCKKGSSAKEEEQKTGSTILTDPATGWKPVATIPFNGLGVGATPYNAMKGFDLQKVDGKFAVLYTQHSFDPAVHAAADYFYKTQVAENARASGMQEISFGIFSGGGNGSTYTYYGQFLPGSYTPVFTGIDYTNNYIDLRDHEGDTYAGSPASNYPTFKYLADGEFLAGSLWLGHESFIWHHKNPPNPIGDFSSTYRPGIIDGNKRLFNIPLKFSDGKYYEFSLAAKDNAISFMVIRCRDDRSYGATPPNYEMVDFGAVAGLSTSSVQLVTYDFNPASTELTFVFADYQSSAEGTLYGYRWKQGSLIKLWQMDLSSDADFKIAIKGYTNKNMLNEWRLKPDGTFYTLSNSADVGSSSQHPWIKLWEVNAAGIKLLSSFTEAQIGQKEFSVSTCRYIDGAYYALAFPTGDSYYRIGDPHYHMEVIRLTQ